MITGVEFLEIDGGRGEGGGQIIRTAITLSCITKQPIRVENIRKNRRVPGLKPQHLTAVTILQKIANAKVVGAEIGSTRLEFIPGDIKSAELTEDIKTAGSISLVVQVLILVAAVGGRRLGLEIRGGTDVLWSPSISYTQYVLKNAYAKMGIGFEIQTCRPGYYPKGGGRVKLTVYPSTIKAARFSKRTTQSARLTCSFSRLSDKTIADNVNAIKKILTDANFTVESKVVMQQALDSGASLLIYSADEGSIIGADGLFDQNTQRFSLDVNGFVKGYSVDENLADMLVVPASLADGKTVFHVRRITRHLETNLYVASQITGCKYGVGRVKDREGFEVIIEGVSYSRIK